MLIVFQCDLLWGTAVCLGRSCVGWGCRVVDHVRDHGGFLLLVGLQNGVKDWVGKDVLAVVQVIISSQFNMDIIPFYCIEVCALGKAWSRSGTMVSHGTCKLYL